MSQLRRGPHNSIVGRRLALTYDAARVSCDADFIRFERLRWENPLR